MLIQRPAGAALAAVVACAVMALLGALLLRGDILSFSAWPAVGDAGAGRDLVIPQDAERRAAHGAAVRRAVARPGRAAPERQPAVLASPATVAPVRPGVRAPAPRAQAPTPRSAPAAGSTPSAPTVLPVAGAPAPAAAAPDPVAPAVVVTPEPAKPAAAAPTPTHVPVAAAPAPVKAPPEDPGRGRIVHAAPAALLEPGSEAVDPAVDDRHARTPAAVTHAPTLAPDPAPQAPAPAPPQSAGAAAPDPPAKTPAGQLHHG